jgi:hypothetical protein
MTKSTNPAKLAAAEQWHRVVLHYLKLPSENQRQLFVNKLSATQKNYFLALLKQRPAPNLAQPTASQKAPAMPLPKFPTATASNPAPLTQLPLAELLNNAQANKSGKSWTSQLQKLETKKNAHKPDKLRQWGLAQKQKMKALLEQIFRKRKLQMGIKQVAGLTAVFALISGFFAVGFVSRTGLINLFNQPEISLAQATPENYLLWIGTKVKDSAQYDQELDIDGDGLTNWHEFLLNSDPSNKYENKNNVLDGQDTLAGTNPTNGHSLNPSGEVGLAIHRLKNQIALGVLNQSYQTSANAAKTQPKDYLKVITDTSTSGMMVLSKSQLSAPLHWRSDKPLSPATVDKEFLQINQTVLGKGGNIVIYGFNSQFTATVEESMAALTGIATLEPQDTIIITSKTENNTYVAWKFVVTGKNLVQATDALNKETKDVTELSLLTLDTPSQGAQLVLVKCRLVDTQKIEIVNAIETTHAHATFQ